MQLDMTECGARVEAARFGVLGTVDRDRGTHLVPVVFVADGSTLIIPIDTVKAKTSTRLRRVRNLEKEPKATLLVDHRDDEWQNLWWVRVDLISTENAAPASAELEQLADKYPIYASVASVASVLRFNIASYRGWAASGGSSG